MLQITEKKNDVRRSRSARKTLVLFVGLDEASEVSNPFYFVIVKEKNQALFSLLFIAVSITAIKTLLMIRVPTR